MKRIIQTKQRSLLYFIIVPLIIVVGWLGYQAFVLYANYLHEQNKISYIAIIDKTGMALEKLGDEELSSALYVSSETESDDTLKRLKQSRASTDALLDDLNRMLGKTGELALHQKQLSLIGKNLNFTRSRVEILSSDYKSIFFDTYHEGVTGLLINLMESLSQQFGSKERAETLRYYRSIGKRYTLSTLEKSFITLKLNQGKAFEDKDLILWEYVLEKGDRDDPGEIKESRLLEHVNALLNNKKRNDTLAISRVRIIQHISEKFHFDVKKWSDLMGKNEQSLREAMRSITGAISQEIREEITSQRQELTLAIVLGSLGLIFVLYLLYYYFKVREEDTVLEDLIASIEELSSGKDTGEDLPVVPKNLGNKKEVYRYMESILHLLHRKEKEAEVANSSKSDFLANMSHEIRTPLNGIVGFTELLKGSGLNTEQTEFIQIVEKSSENLLSVINDVLDLSKIESGKVDIEEIAFEPVVEFESGIESYGAKASEKDIEFGFYITPSLAEYELIGDPSKIKQILVNLASNAIKFTPTGGVIDVKIEIVSSTEDTDTIQFSVQDTGIGVSKEQQSKIFEAFSQEDSSTSRKYGGTGLGLTISSKLVHVLGGERLELTSEKGKGAKFFFTLEMKKRTDKSLAREHHDDLHVSYYLDPARARVSTNKYIEEYIRSLSTQSDTCSNLDEIISKKVEDQPDILFVKHSMISSHVLQKLRKIDSKIVLLTSLHDKEEADRLKLNPFRVLYAPITFSKIKNTLMMAEGKEKEKREEVTEKYTNLKLLVAEDNEINQKLIKRVLEAIGIDVTLADNGKEALEKRVTEDFDMILMDIQMPIMTGVEATHAILDYEKKNQVAHIPTVALTANALKGDRERYLKEGMDDYLTKPLQLRALKEILSQHFASKRKAADIEAMRSLSDSDAIPVDIILLKYNSREAIMFEAILKKIGYSVEVAKDAKDLKSLLMSRRVKYVLLDKRTVVDESDHSDLSALFRRFSIATLLFVESMREATHTDEHNFTMVAPNIPNIELMRNYILRLSKRAKTS